MANEGTDPELEKLRYPVGRFVREPDATHEQRLEWIGVLEALPARMRQAVAALDDAALDAPYRPGGWTRRQVVHHVPDSHLNAYVRTRLALTEDAPTIRPYDEKKWAELADTRMEPDVSLDLLEALHARWVRVLRSMSEDDFARTWIHPASGEWDLDGLLQLYAWHSRHHLGHLGSLRSEV